MRKSELDVIAGVFNVRAGYGETNNRALHFAHCQLISLD